MATWYVDQECGTVIPGTSVTLTNGSTAMTGDGTDFTNPSINGKRVKLTADAGEKWALVSSVTNATTATLSANYTGAGGTGEGKQTANSGVSAADAWVNIASAFAKTGYTAGDLIKCRAGQTHTAAAQCDLGSSGTLVAPLRLTICDASWAEIPDADKAANRTTFTVTGYQFHENDKGYWIIEGIYFLQTNQTYCLLLSNALALLRFRYCIAENRHTSSCYAVYAGGHCRFENGTIVCNVFGWYHGTTKAVSAFIRDTTIVRYSDGTGGEGYSNEGTMGSVHLENVTFGAASKIFAKNISQTRLGRVTGRNVIFLTGTTDISTLGEGADSSIIAIEDYGGVKGAWYLKTTDGRVTNINANAVADTPAGAKKYTDTVIRAICSANINAYIPGLIAEFPVYIGTGTKTVTVWTQPDGWAASPPNTQGAAAILWAEVAAWDVATSKYLYFDSRNKATQTAQVEDAWRDIVVENVEVDAAGWIIVRVYWGGLGNGAKKIYVDMAPQVV